MLLIIWVLTPTLNRIRIKLFSRATLDFKNIKFPLHLYLLPKTERLIESKMIYL
jgi:hypothetical protein